MSTTLRGMPNINVQVSGARGAVGIDIDGTIEPGQFLVKSPVGQRGYVPSSGTGADAGLRTDLAGTSGGGFIGWLRSAAGAVARTLASKISDLPNSVRDFGAATDGSTDARPAFALADAAGGFLVPPGAYKIATSITINSRVRFELGARLNIPNGVTVTFAGGIEAGDYQIFNLFGTGAVAGLAASRLAWFANDLLNSPTQADATPYIQAAYNACNQHGVVRWPAGDLYTSGAGINVANGQHTVGVAKWRTRLLCTSTTFNGLLHSVVEGSTLHGLTMDMASNNTIATAGDQISFSGGAGNSQIDACELRAGFNAIHWIGVNGGKATATDVDNAMNSAHFIDGAPNIEVSDSENSAFSDWVDLSSTSGFVAGESITWLGGTGSYGYTTSPTRAKIVINDVSPAVGATITGATSGATATLSALYVGHASGGVRLAGNAAGALLTNCQWAGGSLALVSDAVNDAHGSRPEYASISNCYFDHTDGGAQINKGVGFSFSTCWFSSRHYNGLSVLGGSDHGFTECKFDASWNHGAEISAAASRIRFNGGYARGNNRSNNGKDGIHIDANANDVKVMAMGIGGNTGFGGVQTYPIRIDAGTSAQIMVQFCTISTGNTNNSVSNGGTGAGNLIGNNS